jgi:alpha-D-xyloside xylohydrolase
MITHQFKSLEHREIKTTSGLILTLQNACLSITGSFDQVFGFGERYNAINQKNNEFDNRVVDHFCNQGNLTYFPLPFFFIPNELGLFIKTKRAIHISIQSELTIQLDLDDECEIIVLSGQPKEMISDFMMLSGKALLPPKWAFGPWMSAHRWNTEDLVDQQLSIAKELKFPFTVMVLEQWSDEATFYVFNGATYQASNEAKKYSDFIFDQRGPWKNPKAMIERIHKQGLKLLLWQIPVIKKLEPKDMPSLQHSLDWEAVDSKQLTARLPDGSAFTIPQGHWFPGSMIPDFSQSETKNWWFSRRQHLLDIGVDGFKTDGGEHIYREDILFKSGENGKSMVNQYSHDYIEAYREFVGKERTLFSRAGYVGQQSVGIQWAGDQKSTWSEFQSVFKAGINAGLSGQPFWSFDIAGFAGDLPELELYYRSTQLSVFSPIMQLHSEPVGGQFSLITKEKVINNERTPWNIAHYHNDQQLIENIRKYYWLRMNLLPHIYSESIKCVDQNQVLMKHLMVDYPEDPIALVTHDQYLFANLLVAPILDKGVFERHVYFPKGDWYGLFSDQRIQGGTTQLMKVALTDVLVFVKSGTALLLNTDSSGQLMSDVGNRIDHQENHRIKIYGKQGSHHFLSETEDFILSWGEGKTNIVGTGAKDYPIVWIN